jgi:T-complex protein 1 subunit delta
MIHEAQTQTSTGYVTGCKTSVRGQRRTEKNLTVGKAFFERLDPVQTHWRFFFLAQVHVGPNIPVNSHGIMSASATTKEVTFAGREKSKDVRTSNILAARAVADIVRTSLGPKGMDKLITSSDGQHIITNDGATILSKLETGHPAAKMVRNSSCKDAHAPLARIRDVALMIHPLPQLYCCPSCRT